MESSRQNLLEAFSLLRQGNLPAAETRCREILATEPRNPDALHLLGLVLRESGQLDEAERMIRASLQIAPVSADPHSNLGFLLRRLGRHAEAASEFRQALALAPLHVEARFGLALTLESLREYAACEAECRELLRAHPRHPEAWILLGNALRAQTRGVEAEQAYRRALEIEPRNATAHHNLGALFSQLERAEEALEELQRAQALGLTGVELAANVGRTLSQLYRFEEAERAYAAAVSVAPAYGEAQLNLARLRYMQGDAQFDRSLVEACKQRPQDVSLRVLHARVLRRAGNLRDAARVLYDLLAQDDANAEARAELAAILHEGGQLLEAENQALEAAAARRADPRIVETLALILLARGRPDEALQFIRPQRERVPHEQTWIAYEATAHRLSGDEAAYRRLYDYDRFVRVYDLAPPPGWRSMAELNAAVLRALEARHRLPTHPLDQSLRNGSQTARSLLTERDPAIQALLTAFAAPIADYLRAIGERADHPLSARNRGGAHITGAWSVRLNRDGFHVNHVHPQGWISSAYYVSVPAEVADERLRSGWLKFGEPRYPVPGAAAELMVQPVPGRLVLFPSYMWHGTNPIHGSEPRTTVAFDANP